MLNIYKICRLRCFPALEIPQKRPVVLQGSVETLFRWGGKRLHYSVAKLFGIVRTKFYKNHPTFIEDMTNISAYLFLDAA